MSFILDALRKSEHERQRSAVPSISQVPLAPPRRELPDWALALMVLLGVAVLGLAGAWWQSTRSSASGIANLTPAARVEIPLQLPSPVDSPPSAPRTEAATTSRPLATAADSPSLRADTAPLSAQQPPRPASSNAVPVLSAADLAARGIVVPALRLELHAYGERSADRFVFINGTKYIEGDRLAEGPQLVTIEPNGAVLSQQGQRFLLAPQ